MRIHFASDHAGYEYKNELLEFVANELGYEVVDDGAYELDMADDYPDFVHKTATAVSNDPANTRGIILGGSGQGEAITANRHSGVRAVVYYGEPAKEQVDASGAELNMITSTRMHNDANVLSIGARFISIDEAKRVVWEWLGTDFVGGERHDRRIAKIEEF